MEHLDNTKVGIPLYFAILNSNRVKNVSLIDKLTDEEANYVIGNLMLGDNSKFYTDLKLTKDQIKKLFSFYFVVNENALL